MGFGLGLLRGSWVLSSGGVGLLRLVRRWLSCGVSSSFSPDCGEASFLIRIWLRVRFHTNLVTEKLTPNGGLRHWTRMLHSGQ